MEIDKKGAYSQIFCAYIFFMEAIRIYVGRDSFFIHDHPLPPYATHIETFWRRNATYKSRFR